MVKIGTDVVKSGTGLVLMWYFQSVILISSKVVLVKASGFVASGGLSYHTAQSITVLVVLFYCAERRNANG